MATQNELRTVIFQDISGKMMDGFFHKWVMKKGEYGDEYNLALIERENGTMVEIHCESITFTDRNS